MTTRDAIAAQVRDLITEHTGIIDIDDRQALGPELRLMPLDVVQLVERFEARNGVAVALNHVAAATTVAELISAFHQAVGGVIAEDDDELDPRHGAPTFRGFAVAMSRVDVQDRWQRKHVARWRARRSAAGREARSRR
ncbi:MAG: hypothetical protein KBG15_02935 [Kofleriaceae bacterium]|nr:hypothetical protein [Kofleriaceae bacterium]